MLSLVENVRRKQIVWVEAILEHKGWRVSRLAKEAGVDHSTIAKFFNDPSNSAQINTTTVEKLALAGGIPPYQTLAPSAPRGLSESEAEPYLSSADPGISRAISALKDGRNGVDAWVLHSRALEEAGYFPGDILLIDLNGEPQDGDAVCAQVYGKNGGAQTVMRIYEKPFLVAATKDRALRKPLLVDGENVIVRGFVMATLRPRQAA